MPRIQIPAPDALPADSKPLLDAIEKQMGVVPNLFRLIALSPAVLQGSLGLNAALGKTLDVKTRERIALAIAQENGCDYCLSAHSYVGLHLAKLDDAEIARNRAGGSSDPRAGAAVAFALQIARVRGRVTDADLQAVRAAGFTDAQIVEIVALVAENVFTNYLNNVARTDVDFPAVRAAERS